MGDGGHIAAYLPVGMQRDIRRPAYANNGKIKMKKLLIYLLSIFCILSPVTQGAFVPISPQQFNDATFRIFDNTDPTKRLAFEVSGISTGTTRTFTLPDASGMLLLTDLTSGYLWVGSVSNIAAGVAMSGDVTISNTGVATVADDSHNHIITNIDPFTEAQLETQLSDVTNVFTNNDGALEDDDVTLADVQSATSSDFHNIGGTDDDVPESGDFGAAADLEADGSLSVDVIAAAEMADADHGEVSWSGGVASIDADVVEVDRLSDVDTVADAPARDEVLKWNGSNWVPAAYGYTFELTIASFSDNENATQLIGSGVWRAYPGDVITFDATYNNGPPDSASIAITSDDGSYTPWGTDPLVMDSPYAQKSTTENTNYPTVKDKYVRFTLTAVAGGDSPTDAETVTFRNYIWYGDPAKASGFTESDVEGETSILSNDQTRSVTINAGAGEYLMFAFPATYTSLPVGTDYETDGDNGTGFVFNGITCACIEDTTTLSITNSAGYTENYKVYVSTTAELGNHTLTTYTSTTEINTIYWGEHTGTDANEAVIEGMNGGGSAGSNDNTRTFSVAPGAEEYIWFAYPKRLGTVSIRDDDTKLPLDLYASSPQTVSVTNSNGWSEDYYAYRSKYANLGSINIETY